MSDIATRLREPCGLSSLDEERAEAAAEIERLREALREIAALTGGGSIHEIARAALRVEEG